MKRSGLTILVILAIFFSLACGGGDPLKYVFIPIGTCESGRIEIQRWKSGNYDVNGDACGGGAIDKTREGCFAFYSYVDAEKCIQLGSNESKNLMRYRCAYPQNTNIAPGAWVLFTEDIPNLACPS